MIYIIKALSVLLFLLILFTSSSNAEDWQLYVEKKGIRIEFRYIDCDFNMGYDQQWILLKISNTSANTKLVEWKSNLWYNNECKTCNVEGQEYHRIVSVDSGKTLEGACSLHSNGDLTLFVKFIDKQYQSSNPQVLTKFELGDLSITSIN